MAILYLFVAIISVQLWIKWIGLIILTPYIRKQGKTGYDKLNQERTNPKRQITKSEIDSVQNRSNKFSLRSRIRYLLDGYIRYISFQVGLIPSHRIRMFIYKHIFKIQIKEKAIIYWDCEIRGHGKLSIGKGTIIGDHAILDARCGIDIGDNVNLSNSVSMWTNQHDYNDPFFRTTPEKSGPITIKNRVWIGPNVTILHSVTIGEGAVVAAGAVVTKDIPPFSLAGGIPAKVIGQRNKDLTYEFKGRHIPFY